MKRLPAAVRPNAVVILLVTIMTGVSGCAKNKNPGSTPAPVDTGVSVPAVYQPLYTQLRVDMDSYNSSLDARSSTYPRPAYGAELLPANGNRGEDLLKPENRAGTVAYLDRLEEMGVQGVTIAMPYPMYMPGSARHDEYADYCKYVFDEIRKRGMIAEVETGVIFAGTAFSPSDVDFGKLTFEQYRADKKRMAQAIIDDLHPDYLDPGAEPDTEYKLTGWNEFNSPASYAGYVSDVLDGLVKGGSHGRVLALQDEGLLGEPGGG
jgi:hypothetical protein